MPQMTATCMACCSSDEYLTALKAEGFTRDHTVEVDGKTYTHDEIAAVVDAAYRRHRPQFTVAVGSRRHVVRKNQRQFEKAVKSDVGAEFHISWLTLAFGFLVLLLTGPLGLIFACIACVFEYYLSRDLDGDTAFCMAMESGN